MKSKLSAGKPEKLVVRIGPNREEPIRKPPQETERPPQQVVPVSGRKERPRKDTQVKSIRKWKIENFPKYSMKQVLLFKKEVRIQPILDQVWKEGPGSKKTLNVLQFTHTFRYQPQEGASSTLRRKDHLTTTLLQEHH